jgi:hypothetical protein
MMTRRIYFLLILSLCLDQCGAFIKCLLALLGLIDVTAQDCAYHSCLSKISLREPEKLVSNLRHLVLFFFYWLTFKYQHSLTLTPSLRFCFLKSWRRSSMGKIGKEKLETSKDLTWSFEVYARCKALELCWPIWQPQAICGYELVQMEAGCKVDVASQKVSMEERMQCSSLIPFSIEYQLK